jgi:4-carboxymuconolactone decarboxylase
MTVYRFQGDYLRLKPAIGTKLFRLIIFVTALEWTRDYECCLHPPMAEVGHQTGNHRRHRSDTT